MLYEDKEAHMELRQTQFYTEQKQKLLHLTKKDVLRWCINVLIWFAFTRVTYEAIEIIHRGDREAVQAFWETHPQVMVLNFLVLLVVTSPALIFKRTHFVAIVLCFISGLAAQASAMILSFRGTPLIWSDFYTIKEGLSIADRYITQPVFEMLLTVLVVMIVVLVVAFLIRYKNYGVHIVWRLLVWAVVCTGLVTTTHGLIEKEVELIAWDLNLSYERNGFVYSFAHSYLETFRQAPEGYGKETIATLKEGFKTPEKDQEAPNVIIVQLEGLMDPALLEGVTYSEDAMAHLRAAGEQYVMGQVQVPTIGGGTVRSEFEVLTGMNTAYLSPGEIPYNSGILKKGPVESLGHVLSNEGYYTTAMHNFQGNFYSRNTVFATLGFDTFIPMEAMVNLEKIGGVWPKDHVLLDYIDKTMGVTEEKDFIYAVAVSSHGPFQDCGIPENYIEVTGVSDEAARSELEIYLQRAKEVDLFVKDLVAYVENLEEHTVLVMFSDHYPSLKIVEQVTSEQKFLTPYVVVDNQKDISGQMPEQLEAYELGSYLLELYGIQGGMMNRYQTSYRDSATYEQGLEQIQYDLLFGNHYVLEGEAPYETTAMKIGMDELLLADVSQGQNEMVVTGDGFNQSSKIYIDGEEVPTIYIDAQTLIYEGSVVGGPQQVVVKQIGRNNISLLETEVLEVSP